MPRADLKRVEVTPAVPAVYEERVILTMTKEEAKVIFSLLANSNNTGSSAESKCIDPLINALRDVGVVNYQAGLVLTDNCIWFTEQDRKEWEDRVGGWKCRTDIS